jgi:hypothetical protein
MENFSKSIRLKNFVFPKMNFLGGRKIKYEMNNAFLTLFFDR